MGVHISFGEVSSLGCRVWDRKVRAEGCKKIGFAGHLGEVPSMVASVDAELP